MGKKKRLYTILSKIKITKNIMCRNDFDCLWVYRFHMRKCELGVCFVLTCPVPPFVPARLVYSLSPECVMFSLPGVLVETFSLPRLFSHLFITTFKFYSKCTSLWLFPPLFHSSVIFLSLNSKYLSVIWKSFILYAVIACLLHSFNILFCVCSSSFLEMFCMYFQPKGISHPFY